MILIEIEVGGELVSRCKPLAADEINADARIFQLVIQVIAIGLEIGEALRDRIAQGHDLDQPLRAELNRLHVGHRADVLADEEQIMRAAGAADLGLLRQVSSERPGGLNDHRADERTVL